MCRECLLSLCGYCDCEMPRYCRAKERDINKKEMAGKVMV